MGVKDGKYIIQYKVLIENISPLNVSDGDDMPMICRDTEEVYIPATSISGAFKDYLSSIAKNKIDISDMFGGKSTSKIYIEDTFAHFKDYEYRPAVKIDDFTGAVSNKFERIFVQNGHIFELKLEIHENDLDKLKAYEKAVNTCIHGIDLGYIRLGSFKTSGFGCFKVRNIEKREFNFEKKKDIFSYLRDDRVWSDLDIKDCIEGEFKDTSYVRYELKGGFRTPVLVKRYDSLDSSKEDSEPMICGDGSYVIPASAVKGIIRHEGERILKYLKKDKYIEKIFGSRQCDQTEENKTKSLLSVFDIVVKKEDVVDTIYNKIKIDKFTGGISSGALCDEKAIKFQCEIKAQYRKSGNKTIDDSAIALIALIFRDLSLGEITIGSGNAVGRGRFEGNCLQIFDEGDTIFDGNINSGDIINDKMDKYIKCLNSKEEC